MNQDRPVWHTVLDYYTEDPESNHRLYNWIMDPDLSVFWIRHDKGAGKPHRHIVVKFPYAKTQSAAASYLGCQERLTRPITKKDERTGGINAFTKYLLHSDRKSRLLGKVLYRASDFCGPDKQIAIDKASRAAAEPDEYGLADIQAYIKSRGYVSMDDLVSWCITFNCLSILRRYQGIVKTLVTEHNHPMSNLNYIKDIDKKLTNFEHRLDLLGAPAQEPAAVWGVNVELLNEMLRGKK